MSKSRQSGSSRITEFSVYYAELIDRVSQYETVELERGIKNFQTAVGRVDFIEVRLRNAIGELLNEIQKLEKERLENR